MAVMSVPTDDQLTDQTRDIKINIRAKQSQRDLIDYAAKVESKSRSEFILESASQKAQEVLLDRRFFGLDEQKFEQFLTLLDTSPAKNEKLEALLKTKSPWE